MSDDGCAKSKATGTAESEAFISPEEKRDTEVTCDVLCSLSAAYPQSSDATTAEAPAAGAVKEKRKAKSCPKQHQLPLFLSSKYQNILAWQVKEC